MLAWSMATLSGLMAVGASNIIAPDIARIAVFGEPSAKIKSYHRALHRGVQAALEMIEPGVKAAHVFARAVDVRRKRVFITFHVRMSYMGSTTICPTLPD
ncbi:M24 family metallopeptidase [Bradyrhizobium barranii]|uniref:M24 family metallopeptidase n=1 Tax=Bradyrhizobium TaxID=374 RepID=UPI003F28A958